jgi:hypothetical protein
MRSLSDDQARRIADGDPAEIVLALPSTADLALAHADVVALRHRIHVLCRARARHRRAS